jgi:hypothetical protein
MSIHKKLQAIQQELKAPKNQRNDFWKYNYRSCEDILEAVKPLLLKTDCVLTLHDELVNIWDRYYIKSTASFAICSEWEEKLSTAISVWYAREEETKKGMSADQITWACSSYARKYALNGLFLIDDNKDSDHTNTHWEATKASAPIEPDKSIASAACTMCWQNAVPKTWEKNWKAWSWNFCTNKACWHITWN